MVTPENTKGGSVAPVVSVGPGRPDPNSGETTSITEQGFEIVFLGKIDPVAIFSRHGESMTFTLRDLLALPDLVCEVLFQLSSLHPCKVTDQALAEKLERLSTFSFAAVFESDQAARDPMGRDE